MFNSCPEETSHGQGGILLSKQLIDGNARLTVNASCERNDRNRRPSERDLVARVFDPSARSLSSEAENPNSY